jgi:hypothetical protein
LEKALECLGRRQVKNWSESLNMEGWVFVPLHPKLAVKWLSYRVSEVFFEDSRQLSSGDSENVQRHMSRLRTKFRKKPNIQKLWTFCRNTLKLS